MIPVGIWNTIIQVLNIIREVGISAMVNLLFLKVKMLVNLSIMAKLILLLLTKKKVMVGLLL